ncbi:MAG: PQQ-binding-like beta-propeller repeat protein, partial [Edaphobacter sp.]
MRNPFASDPSAVASGKLLFEQTCQSCHGSEARGDRGPALTSNNLRHGNQDTDIFQTVRAGIPGTQMPAFTTLPSDSIWRIISYLRSLNPSGSDVSERVPGDASMGEKIFSGKAACNTCHEVNGAGGIVGPDLSATGINSVEFLHDSITKPNKAAPRSYFSRGPSRLTVKARDGREIRGVLVAEDGYTLILRDVHGTIHRFNVADLLDRKDEAKSLMPDNYAQTLTPPEIEDLVAYLKTLKSPDSTKIAQAKIPGGLSFERLRNANAEPQNWPTYWGDYQGHHFSPLTQITPANVKRLATRWSMQMPGDSLLEATPLVIDGTMYTSGQPGQVFAIDAKSGLQIWKFERRQKVLNPYQTNPFNRGVAVLGGRVFVGTLDAALVALDARTGRKLWETQVADTLKGYTITSAPLAINGKVIVGVAGGEFGIRGFVDAYDAATGKLLWRFNTIPGPGEFGSKTWSNDSWKQGSGATWLTGSYDPDLDLLYWTVGNPGPDMNPSVRQGDNLFTSSVLALDPATGIRKWHYQFTPNDSHDWDANQDVVLADRTINGKKRKLLMQANRNGMFYVLDRTNGKFIFAKSYVKQTWNSGFDANGRPILLPGSEASPEGVIVYPSGVGGTNWQSPSYDPERSLLYVVTRDGAEG